MKNKTCIKLLWLLSAMLLACPAYGQASLDFVSRTQITENNQRAKISVFPETAGYESTNVVPATSGTFGDGTVTDYRFVRSDGNVLISYADGGAGVAAAPTAPLGAGFVSGTQNWSNVWEANDPGVPLFSTAADIDPAGWSGGADVVGTIDMTTMTGAGSLYVMHGTFVNQWSITVTMSGPSVPDIVASDAATSNGPSTNQGWISEFKFSGAAGYDTLTYYYFNADRDGSRARFMGVIVDADTSPPAIVELSPPDDSTTVFVGSNLSYTFDEDFDTIPGGNITILDLDNTTSTVISIDDTTQVSIVDRTVTLDPAVDLLFETNYAVQIGAGWHCDFAVPPNYYPGIPPSDTTTWNFTTLPPDTTAPVITVFSPDVGTTTVPGVDLVATFDEGIQALTGNVILRNLTGAIDTTIDILDASQITIVDNILTISPTNPLAGGANYAIQIEMGAIENLSGIAHLGIINDTTWTFSTLSETTLVATGNWVGGTWDNGEPGPGLNAIIDTGVAATANNSVAPWSGVLTLRAGSSLRMDSSTNPNQPNMAFDGATQFVLNDGSVINDNFKTATFNQDWVISGTAGLDSNSNAGNNHNRTFTGTISGDTWVTDGRNLQGYTYNSANTFTAYEVRSSESQRHGVFFGAPGSAGLGDVTVTSGNGTASAALILGSGNVFSTTCVLTLNGKGWNGSSGGFGPYAGGAHVGNSSRISVGTFDNTVSELFVDDIQIPMGTYTGTDFDWIVGGGTLTVVNGVNDPPTLTSIEDNAGGGPILEDQSITYFVTFNEAIDPASVTADDFENGGSPAAAITDVLATSDPAVFAVCVTPGGAGTLVLQIKAGTEILDAFGLGLDTTVALPDDTTITVNAGTSPPRDAVTVDGTAFFQSTGSPVTGTFDASGSDKLVVVLTGEHGFNNDAGDVTSVTYDGVALTRIIDRNAQVSGTDTIYNEMWILDNPTTSTGSIEANVVTRGNVTVFGLSGTAEGVGATAITPTDTRSVGIATTVPNSVVVVSFGMGGAGNGANVTSVTSDAPLTQVSAQENGSNWDGHVVAWATAPAACYQTYSFTGGTTDGAMVIAAEFPGALPSDDYGVWAAMFPGADLSDPNGDFDGDGVSNNDERLFGTDPTKASSLHQFPVGLFESTTSTFSFSRRDNALTGLFSDIETSFDLVMWTEDIGAMLVEGTVDGSTNVEIVEVTLSPGLLTAPKLFVRVNQNEGVFISENFEVDDGGFTVSTTAGTDWEHGDPDSASPGGAVTEGNGGSTNAWGTNLGDISGTTGDAGYFADTTATALRSTVIDLTGIAAAELLFAEAIDIQPGDTAEVFIIDDILDTVIGGGPIHTSTDGDINNAAWANVGPIAIPGAALGQPVRIEWRFTGANGTTNMYMGWYIDDVTVRKTP